MATAWPWLHIGQSMTNFDHEGLQKSLEEYLLDESNSREVTVTIAIFKLKAYPQEPEQTFRLRVVRALMWVGMDAISVCTPARHIQGYMSIQ